MAFRFPPDVQKRLDKARYYQVKKRREAEGMTLATLIASAQYAMQQMPQARAYSGGEPVYDGQFFHVLFPEICRRLGFTEHRYDLPRAANEEWEEI